MFVITYTPSTSSASDPLKPSGTVSVTVNLPSLTCAKSFVSTTLSSLSTIVWLSLYVPFPYVTVNVTSSGWPFSSFGHPFVPTQAFLTLVFVVSGSIVTVLVSFVNVPLFSVSRVQLALFGTPSWVVSIRTGVFLSMLFHWFNASAAVPFAAFSARNFLMSSYTLSLIWASNVTLIQCSRYFSASSITTVRSCPSATALVGLISVPALATSVLWLFSVPIS